MAEQDVDWGATEQLAGSGPRPKMVYAFGPERTEGSGALIPLLGGKGANLAEMTAIGLPVPPGFTITTDTCALYLENGGLMPAGLLDEVEQNVRVIERATGKGFGAIEAPLLVSVRSGAAVSMPGMMDTVLNLGLTDETVAGLVELTGNERFAWDAYRRLINMFAGVVMDIDHQHFETEFTVIKSRYGVTEDTDLSSEGLKELCEKYKAVYEEEVGEEFPQDPEVQLQLAIEAVFRSWNSKTAIAYRAINDISGLSGTAVSVQTMVFGNMGNDSGTGVAFTRDPSTGQNELFGEFLINAQGEDVVAGIRTPRPVSEMGAWDAAAFVSLLDVRAQLEQHYQDVQDIEFTVERGTFWMLQTRTGKRTAAAAVKIAVDMVEEGLIGRRRALLGVPAGDLTQLLLPSYSADDKADAELLATGLPASPGAAWGKLAFTADEVVERTAAGEQVLLVRHETSPEDIEGMHHASGVLTSTGGMTSHAAVVARGWGKCCVAGAGALQINAAGRTVSVGDRVFGPQDVLSIDGATGEVLVGRVDGSRAPLSTDFETIMKWADEERRLEVRANADSPSDAERARTFGATGIGLTRTEHMFFDGQRISAMRQMILADTTEGRVEALAKLLPYQRRDFEGILTAMEGLPVTIRLLDPPLHEFLPNDKQSQRELAEEMGVSRTFIRERVEALHESNPMLGHRGCRLAITFPEILHMQVTAITEAAIACRLAGVDAQPEIMVPLVGTDKELARLRAEALATVASVRSRLGFEEELVIPVGTMIEIPRAALTAGAVALEADFFSFGTNDLTQLTSGFSRDDVSTFLPEYLASGLLEHDPFQTIDVSGVGRLVEIATADGRAAKPDLKVGVCGEHGGDPASIEFFDQVGVDYISCSPFRVPTARLASAQSAIRADIASAVVRHPS